MCHVGQKKFHPERVLMYPPNHRRLNDYGLNVIKLQ